jgi:hypothetical protein
MVEVPQRDNDTTAKNIAADALQLTIKDPNNGNHIDDRVREAAKQDLQAEIEADPRAARAALQEMNSGRDMHDKAANAKEAADLIAGDLRAAGLRVDMSSDAVDRGDAPILLSKQVNARAVPEPAAIPDAVKAKSHEAVDPSISRQNGSHADDQMGATSGSVRSVSKNAGPSVIR